jgi:hypothetical protein
MLGTLIEKLSGLLSKSFVIAAFIPLFTFFVLNGVLLYFQSVSFHQVADRYAGSPTHIAAVLISIAIASFFFSMQNTRLREVMEGRYLPSRLKASLTVDESSRYRRLLQAEVDLRRERRQYDKTISAKTWHKLLSDARSAAPKANASCQYSSTDPAAIEICRLDNLRQKSETIRYSDMDLAVRLLAKVFRDNPLPEGVKAADLIEADDRKLEAYFQRAEEKNPGSCAAARRLISDAKKAKPTSPACQYSPDHSAAEAIAVLGIKYRAGHPLGQPELDNAANLFAAVLSSNTIPPDAEAGKLLNRHQDILYELFQYAQDRSWDKASSLFSERQFNFPSSALAPTAMGNVAGSVRSYALSRYSLNLDTFWTRLQKVMQPDPFYTVLQDAKVQLDFMVAVFWLGLVTAVIWIPVLALTSGNLSLFLFVAFAGWFGVSSSYGLALRNYQVFADLMRTGVDLFRLPLLKELRAPEPTGSTHEALLWQAVEERMGFGAPFNLTYELKK